MDAVEDIKQRLNIEDVIGEYVELKRAGRNYKGLSPFTSERTASFMVSPEKQIWHDFSSNKGGTMFSFIMEMEGVEFPGAIEILARKAGIDLSLYRRGDGKTAQRKERVYELLEVAAKYYQHVLLRHEVALKYLRQTRGYSKETIQTFRFGYSPDDGRSLGNYLVSKGFTSNELYDAGVITERRTGPVDMFRGRIMVPLSDGQGRVVGFTARLLHDEPNAPKYINTPSTIVYDKGRQLYGLHMAKQAIRTKGYAVVVEGNLDVVASHQAGVENVVAVAGTALTLDHLKSLSRLTEDVRFAFDQDRAGVAATERAIPIAQGLGLTLSIIEVPKGKDPDELIKQDPKLWQDITQHNTYVMDWLIAYYKLQHKPTTAQGKTAFSNVIIEAIRRLQDPVEQEHYLRVLAEELGVTLETVQRKFQNTTKETAPKKHKPNKAQVVEKTEELEHTIYQDQLLGLSLIAPSLRKSLKSLDEALMSGEERKKMLKLLQDHPGKKETLTREDLREIEDYAKIVAFKGEELYASFDQSARAEEFEALMRRLKSDRKHLKLRNIQKQIKTAEAAHDADALKDLLNQYNDLLRED